VPCLADEFRSDLGWCCNGDLSLVRAQAKVSDEAVLYQDLCGD
jgi:hypothetical protein